MLRYFKHKETQIDGRKFKGIDSECTNVVAATLEPCPSMDKDVEAKLLANFEEIDEYDFLDMKDAGARQLYLAGSVRIFGFL